MKIFIWSHVRQCSQNYHSDGGVVVIAESVEAAVALANANNGCIVDLKVDGPPDTFELVGDAVPSAYIFPDAGCC